MTAPAGDTGAARRGAERRRARRRIAALVSLGVVPAVASWSGGARRRASAVVVGLTTLALVVLGLVEARGGAIASALDPRMLGLLTAVDAVALVVRLAELVLTHQQLTRVALGSPSVGRGRSTSRRDRRMATRRRAGLRWATGSVAAVILLQHAVVGSQLLLARDTLRTVFPPVAVAGPTAAVTGSIAASATVTGPPERTRGTAGRQAPSDGTVDVLLLGLDAGAGRRGARNDANLVVSVEPATGAVSLVSLPRNLIRLPLAGSPEPCVCFRAPLYALYGHGIQRPHRFPGPDPGAEAVRLAVETLLDRDIDHYVVADMGAFLEVIDAIGGVTLEVTDPVRDDKSDPSRRGERVTVDVQPGRHHLDGAETLAFVRSRKGSDDHRRTARQRCVVREVGRPFDELPLREALGLLRTVRHHVTTDVPRAALPSLLTLLREADTGDVASLGLVPSAFATGYVDGFPVPDVAAIRAAVDDLPHDDDGRGEDPC